MRFRLLVLYASCLFVASCHVGTANESGGDGSKVGVSVTDVTVSADQTISIQLNPGGRLDLHLTPGVNTLYKLSTGAWTKDESVNVTATSDNCIIDDESHSVTRILTASNDCKYSSNVPGGWVPSDCGHDFTLSNCTSSGLKVSAKNASQPVSLSLKHQDTHSLKSIAPLNLSATNSYKAEAKLSSGNYDLSVSPVLDGLNYIATFPKTIKSSAKSLTISYQPSSQYLVAEVAYPNFNINSLLGAHYNTAYITGLDYNAGVLSSNGKAANLAALAASLKNSGFNALLQLQPVDLNNPGLMQAVPQNLGIVIDLSAADNANFVNFARKLHQLHPQAVLAFKLPDSLNPRLEGPLQALLQELQTDKVSWHGFVAVPYATLAKPEVYLAGINSSHVVVFVSKADFTASSYNTIATKVSGLVLKNDAKAVPLTLAKAVLLPR